MPGDGCYQEGNVAQIGLRPRQDCFTWMVDAQRGLMSREECCPERVKNPRDDCYPERFDA